MRAKKILGFRLASCLVALPLVVRSADEMKLGDAQGEYNAVVDVPLALIVEQPVQGLVAAFEFKGCGEGIDLIPSELLVPADSADESGADTVVTRVETDYMVLGVVMDSNPEDSETLPEFATWAVSGSTISSPQTTWPIETKCSSSREGAEA